MRRRSFVVSAIFGAGLVLAGAPAVLAGKPQTNVQRGFAAAGHDVVAYFSGKAAPGDDAFTATHDGATYRFASAANRDAFAANPAKFAPQFGGYCAWAVSKGYTATIDPEAWSVEGGKLYLNYSTPVRRQWQQDVPGNIAKGRANWPKVLE